MLFSIRPKNNLEDLYNREREIDMLDDAFRRKVPLIVVMGVRRVGKTSLLRSYLNDRKYDYIWIDLRGALTDREEIDLTNITHQLGRGLRKLMPRFRRLRELLKTIESLSISGLSIKFTRVTNQDTIVSILETLNTLNKTIVIVFDEAQYLRLLRGIDMTNIFAYTYDNLENITIILTGSEVGLLEDFLDMENPDSPLYGRYVEFITLSKFDDETALKFLKAGFEQAKMKPDIPHLKQVVSRLDGIVGWLALYGYIAVKDRNPRYPIGAFVDRAVRLVRKELGKIMRRSKYYKIILKAITLGNITWKNIKEYVEFKLKREVNDAIIDRYLKKLIKLSIIKKIERGRKIIYRIEDPLVAEYVKRL